MRKMFTKILSIAMLAAITFSVIGIDSVFATSLQEANDLNEPSAVEEKLSKTSDLPNLVDVNKQEQTNSFKYLSDIDWESANIADKILPMKDKSHSKNESGEQNPLNVYGTIYEKGIGVHAGHTIIYDLKRRYNSLTAIIAPDNICNSDPSRNMSIMGFVVYADGKEIFRDNQINFHLKEKVDLSLDLRDVNELKLVITQGDNGNDYSDILCIADAKLHYEEKALESILVNNVPLEEFSPVIYDYYVRLDKDTVQVPVITTQLKNGAQATVEQAEKLPGVAKIKVGTDRYTIRFTKINGGEFLSFDLKLPDNSINKGSGIINGNDILIIAPDDVDKTNLRAVFKTAGVSDVVSVGDKIQQSGVTNNDFSRPVYYFIQNEKGITKYTVRISTWKYVSGNYYDGEAKGKSERPYIHDYTKTLTMKLFIAAPEKSSNRSIVSAKFDEVLTIVKQIDNTTRGIPKIIYLVGWQYQGHDDKYPSWAVVNPALKCKKCNHADSRECLTWLMDEALKYNTTISLHLNSTDAYKDSPLWQTYVDNDLISKNIFNNYMKIGTWEGESAYQVNYKNEWEKGFYKKRVDELLKLLPIQRAGTIHSDAFFCRKSKQSSLGEEQEARRKMMRYWRDCGVDITSEFLYSGDEDNYGGDGSGIIGIMPMAYHFNQPTQSYMNRPASLITGGGISDVKYGNEKETIEILFGRTMWGESLLTQRGIYGLAHRPNWDVTFTYEFCTQTVPWAYQNQFKRLNLQNNVVTYCDGLVANANNRTVTRDGKLVRENDNIFVPTAWKDNEVIAYSETGYKNRTWQMQKEWTARNVDVFTVTKQGLIPLQQGVDISDGSITLSLNPKQMITIVPAGSITIKDVPDKAENISVTRCNDNLVKISWDGNYNTPCDYQVFRKASNEAEYSQIGITKEFKMNDTTILARTPGITYDYKVRSISAFSGKFLDSQVSRIDNEEYISDLDWKSVELENDQPWAVPKKDKNIENGYINMDGAYFNKGISIHANGSVTYELGGRYTKFKAILGTDDYNIQKANCTSIVCSVFVDDKLKYQSDLINIRSLCNELNIDVTNGQKLKLVVSDNNDGNGSDWGIWGAARLLPVE